MDGRVHGCTDTVILIDIHEINSGGDSLMNKNKTG